MSSEEQLSELIGQIYDCAIDSALWRTTLPTIAAYLDCSTTLINIVRPSIGNRSIYSLHDYGLSHDAGQLYLEKYAHIDPTVRAGALFDVDEVFTAREAVGDDIWTASPMYNDGFRRPSCVPRVAAAVFVDNPAGKINFRGDIVAKLFNLTGAELQLLLALLDGATLQSAAGQFGVSMATVKTHLQHIFAKTDTSRQSELIRKIASMMPSVSLQ